MCYSFSSVPYRLVNWKVFTAFIDVFLYFLFLLYFIPMFNMCADAFLNPYIFIYFLIWIWKGDKWGPTQYIYLKHLIPHFSSYVIHFFLIKVEGKPFRFAFLNCPHKYLIFFLWKCNKLWNCYWIGPPPWPRLAELLYDSLNLAAGLQNVSGENVITCARSKQKQKK